MTIWSILRWQSRCWLKYKVIRQNGESGISAIEMLKNDNFDMVLMDQVMPGMDGFEAMKLIRSSLVIRGARRMPIVCMTADSGGISGRKVLRADSMIIFQNP